MRSADALQRQCAPFKTFTESSTVEINILHAAGANVTRNLDEKQTKNSNFNQPKETTTTTTMMRASVIITLDYLHYYRAAAIVAGVA
jgi:hypothetical protein